MRIIKNPKKYTKNVELGWMMTNSCPINEIEVYGILARNISGVVRGSRRNWVVLLKIQTRVIDVIIPRKIAKLRIISNLQFIIDYLFITLVI